MTCSGGGWDREGDRRNHNDRCLKQVAKHLLSIPTLYTML